jgi:hypothetical protein
MKRYLPHLFAVTGMVSCVTPGPKLPDGELGRQFTSTVPGTWHNELRRGSVIVDCEKTFHRDGTAQGVLRTKNRGLGVSVVLPPVTFRSKWRIEGDTYISYDVNSPTPGAFDKGQEFRDRILSVSPDRITCRDITNGGVYTMTRRR